LPRALVLTSWLRHSAEHGGPPSASAVVPTLALRVRPLKTGTTAARRNLRRLEGSSGRRRTSANLRAWRRRAARTLGRFGLEAVAAVVPRRPHSVIYGVPDTEGNAVEVARYLVGDKRTRVIWLTQAGDWREIAWTLAGVPHEGSLRVVPKRSLRGLAHFITASRAFYTHVLYLDPRPVRGRIYVNLWHGDGPKLVRTLRSRRPADSVIVAGTALWGANKARAVGLGDKQLLLVGNPRIDQFARPANDESLAHLSLDPRRPFLVWAPTFRTARHGRRLWSDTELLTRATTGPGLGEPGDADGAAPEVVIKPHPLDADDYREYGFPIVDEPALRRAGIGFYQFLARSACLVTDYSSVWTDYLPLDRPVGFYCPDLEEYAQARDIDLDEFRSLLAGPLLRSPEEMLEFCRAVVDGADPGRAERARAIERLGAVVELGATGRLMSAVEEMERTGSPPTQANQRT